MNLDTKKVKDLLRLQILMLLLFANERKLRLEDASISINEIHVTGHAVSFVSEVLTFRVKCYVCGSSLHTVRKVCVRGV